MPVVGVLLVQTPVLWSLVFVVLCATTVQQPVLCCLSAALTWTQLQFVTAVAAFEAARLNQSPAVLHSTFKSLLLLITLCQPICPLAPQLPYLIKQKRG